MQVKDGQGRVHWSSTYSWWFVARCWLSCRHHGNARVFKQERCTAFHGNATVSSQIYSELVREGATLSKFIQERYRMAVAEPPRYWFEIDLLRSQNTQIIVQELKVHMSRYGIPDVLVTDNEPQFWQQWVPTAPAEMGFSTRHMFTLLSTKQWWYWMCGKKWKVFKRKWRKLERIAIYLYWIIIIRRATKS